MNIGVKLSRLKSEDYIWIIYIIIASAAIVSNYYERNYILKNNPNDQKKFKTINIAILVIAFFIYLYFLITNYEDIKTLRKNATKKEVLTSQVAIAAAIIFLIGGILNIYVEINRDDPTDIDLI